MTFKPGTEKNFLGVFYNSREKIMAFEGCTFLELLNDKKNPNVFFTHSHWKSEVELNNYRGSELFKSTWAATKVLFSEKAEAWSLEKFI